MKITKSLVFAAGVTALMYLFMLVLSSPTVNERYVDGPTNNSSFAYAQQPKLIQEKKYRELPPLDYVLTGTFLASFLIGVTVFKDKRNDSMES